MQLRYSARQAGVQFKKGGWRLEAAGAERAGGRTASCHLLWGARGPVGGRVSCMCLHWPQGFHLDGRILTLILDAVAFAGLSHALKCIDVYAPVLMCVWCCTGVSYAFIRYTFGGMHTQCTMLKQQDVASPRPSQTVHTHTRCKRSSTMCLWLRTDVDGCKSVDWHGVL